MYTEHNKLVHKNILLHLQTVSVFGSFTWNGIKNYCEIICNKIFTIILNWRKKIHPSKRISNASKYFYNYSNNY